MCLHNYPDCGTLLWEGTPRQLGAGCRILRSIHPDNAATTEGARRLIDQPHETFLQRVIVSWSVVEAAAAKPQQVALPRDRDRRVIHVDGHPLLLNCPVQSFLTQSSSTFSWPICWYNRAINCSSRWASSSRRRPNTSGSASSSCFFHCVIWFECT